MSLWEPKLPGERVGALRTAEWAALREAAEGERDRQQSYGDREGFYPPAGQVVVLVSNQSGQNLTRFAAVALRLPVVSPGTNLDTFKNTPAFNAYIAASQDQGAVSKVGILAEPIPAGLIGRCVIAGFTPVQMNVGSTLVNQRYADLVAGQTYLQSSLTGAAEIVWCDTGANPVWALVRLGDHCIVAGVRLTSANKVVGSDGILRYPAKEQIYNALTDVWSDGDDCWYCDMNGN